MCKVDYSKEEMIILFDQWDQDDVNTITKMFGFILCFCFIWKGPRTQVKTYLEEPSHKSTNASMLNNMSSAPAAIETVNDPRWQDSDPQHRIIPVGAFHVNPKIHLPVKFSGLLKSMEVFDKLFKHSHFEWKKTGVSFQQTVRYIHSWPPSKFWAQCKIQHCLHQHKKAGASKLCWVQATPTLNTPASQNLYNFHSSTLSDCFKTVIYIKTPFECKLHPNVK